MQFKYAIGATPLEADEIHNLIPTHLTTQKELDEWEQYNIIKAENWLLSRKRSDFLSISFAKDLHNKMFYETWKCGGKFRTKQTNIGIQSIYIGQELKIIFDDVAFWLEHKTYSIREIAVRLHHRLVFIHPFPNGNGRFSRLFADILMDRLQEIRFSWGSNSLTSDSKTRQYYLKALREADNNDYSNLILFADS